MTNICTPDSHQTRLDKELATLVVGAGGQVSTGRGIEVHPAPGCSTHDALVQCVGDRPPLPPSVPALAARRRRSAVCLYSVRVTRTDRAPVVAAR